MPAVDVLPGVPPRRVSTVLLDVNGTLTDPAAITEVWGRPELGPHVLQTAVSTAMVDALLDTADRPFSDHIASALHVLVAEQDLDPSHLEAAGQAAAALPARPGAAQALARLAAAGVMLVALTNSGAQAGQRTLEQAGLAEHVHRVIGVDAVKSFKPHPRVYAHALHELGQDARDVVLVATHPWDLAGAHHAGMQTAWVTYGAPAWPVVLPPPDGQGGTLPVIVEHLLV